MLHTYAAGRPRRAAVLASILALHVGVFLVVLNDTIQLPPPPPSEKPIIPIPPPPLPKAVQPPKPEPWVVGPVRVTEPPPVYVPTDPVPERHDAENVKDAGTTLGVATVPDRRTAPVILIDPGRLAAGA